MTLTAAQAPSLRDYGRILWRRRWIVILVPVLTTAAAIVLAERQAPVYQASSQVLLQNSNLATNLTGVGTPGQPTDPAWLDQTQADLASVPVVARRVLARAGVTGMTPTAFLKHASATPSSNSDVLTLTVSNGDPVLARRLATDYASVYTAYRRQIDTGAVTSALSQAQSRLAALRKQGETNSPLYANVESKVQTLQTLAALETSNAVVIRSPIAATKVSPKPVRDAALALVLGLILGIGLAFVRETLDTQIRSADEIAAALQLPLLGRLPAPPKRLASKGQLSTIAEPSGPNAEAFRVLRTNLDFATMQHETRVILVTSALAGEGKTTVAANLAVTLVRAGRSVVLVDLDLRRPTLHDSFRLEQTPGLTNVALGELTLDEALQHRISGGEERSTDPTQAVNPRNGNGNGSPSAAGVGGMLEVLPAGPLPPNPGELVESPAVQHILDELRDRAQYVILDSPPLLSLGDARSLSTRVDGLLLVMRPTILRRPVLNELHRVLDAIPARKLGFVLGDARSEGRYGYSPPSYGYGRSVEQETKTPVA